MSQISVDLDVFDDTRLRAVFEVDQSAVTELLLRVLYSPTDQQTVLALEEDAAQAVLDLIQHVRTQELTNE